MNLFENLQKIEENNTRSPEITEMMDYIDSCWGKLDEEKFEEILMKHNASEDDSSNEGYFSTMTDENIKDCYKELRQILGEDKYNDIINTILNKGFIENTVDSPYGSASYFTKGSIGIIVCDDKEAKALAKNLL